MVLCDTWDYLPYPPQKVTWITGEGMATQRQTYSIFSCSEALLFQLATKASSAQQKPFVTSHAAEFQSNLPSNWHKFGQEPDPQLREEPHCFRYEPLKVSKVVDAHKGVVFFHQHLPGWSRSRELPAIPHILQWHKNKMWAILRFYSCHNIGCIGLLICVGLLLLYRPLWFWL